MDLNAATAALENNPETAAGRTVFVYEGVVRLWHWLNALCILTLVITGYLIGSPLPSVSGEASANFLMGYIRFAHFAAAYVFAVAFLVRIYWGVVGNHHARQLFTLPLTDAKWWAGMLREIRWYLFLEKQPFKYVGHNPLAHLFMFLFVTVAAILMICTGFALYSEGAGLGSWQDLMFDWVIPLLGGSQATHSWHHLGMWGIVTFVILHVYAAVREDIMSRQTMISTMISGQRSFRQ
jgi:Ni/Fe-hydrogenase 1 B-type cytochrome subunit